MTRTTSAAVYRQIKDSGLLNALQWAVYDHLCECGPMTQAECSDRICRPKPSISPRFAELEKMGAIRPVEKRACSVTGFNCMTWDVTDKMPVKVKKEQPYPSSHLYPLFKHMSDNHDLRLLEIELQEIVWAVERCKK